MDAKDLRKEAAAGDRSKDVTAGYAQSREAEGSVQTKTYQDAGSSPMGKAEAASSRPCAVIGPDRVVPPADYRRPPDYPYKPLDYHHPTRNISPRQTFQENMQRIMVPPSYAATKLKEDHSFQLEPDISPLRNNKLNVSADTKYCDVPYVNPIVNNLKNVRTSDVGTPNTNTVLARSAPEGWPLVSPQGQPSKPYGPSELYQYPEYQSCAAPRAMFMPRPHRTVQEGLSAEQYYHENIRFKPYPTTKERYPQPRYDYFGNYGNPNNAPPLPSHKTMPSNPYPGYSHVPLKYMDTRVSDPAMNTYQRPNLQAAYDNLSFRNPVIHPSYGGVQGNCLQPNKFYPYPDTAPKSMASTQLLPYPDYESTRPKPYPDGFYVNDITRPHLMKSQVMAPNYPTPNMHAMHPHPYYRKDNVPLKNYDQIGHYRHIDPSINVNSNPLPRFTSQFSNTGQMSPADMISNNSINLGQPTFPDDFGYISQSSSASARSYDTAMGRFSNDPFRRYDYHHYGPVLRPPSMHPKFEPNPNINQSSKDKKKLDVRQFLQMWNEGEEETNENNTKDITGNITPNFAAGMGTQATASISSNQEQLYVMGIVNVPSEELGKYEHIQKVSKLPENIKGYNSIEILHKFEEVIESSNLNEFKPRPPTAKDFRGPSKNLVQFQGGMEISMPTRPLSPLDVEAKISQSIIHKEVGCNFEIRPCSPPMLNVENATLLQNIASERAIEKVTNPVITNSGMGMQSSTEIDNFNNVVKGQDQSVTQNRNTMKTSCKMIDTRYPTNDIETIAKPNYSLQDLESNSGVCLASLPRLDNDIELNFPEVNQQFINANKAESVIITTSAQDLPLLDVEKNQESTIVEDNSDICRNSPKLNKENKLKRKITESVLKSKIQAIRTDSVIIKNPDTNKCFEDGLEQSPKSDLDENLQKDPINLTYTVDCGKDNPCDGLAIDFSLNSTDRHLNDNPSNSFSLNDQKNPGQTYEQEHDHNIFPNSKDDVQETNMIFNRSPSGNLEGHQVHNSNKSYSEPAFSIVGDTFEGESMNLDKNSDVDSLNTNITDLVKSSNDEIKYLHAQDEEEIKNIEKDSGQDACVVPFSQRNDEIKDLHVSQEEKIMNIEKGLCEDVYLKSDTKAPKYIKKDPDVDKNICFTQKPEEQATSVLIDNLNGDSFGSNRDKKKLGDCEININVKTASTEKNESEQNSDKENPERCLLLCHPDIETDIKKVNTQNQSKSSTNESVAKSEHSDITDNKRISFENSIENVTKQQIIDCYTDRNDKKSYKEISNEKIYPEPATCGLSTLEEVEMLHGSQNVFFEQPLTPMDITPESSLMQDDTDDCISRDEMVNNYTPDDTKSSFESNDLSNIDVRSVTYFYKEMFSPWMRRLVLNQGQCGTIRTQSQKEIDTECNLENHKRTKSVSDISKNLNTDHANDVLKRNMFNTDLDKNDLHVDDTDVEESNDINQSTRGKGEFMNDILTQNTTITNLSNDSLHGEDTDVEEANDIEPSTSEGYRVNDILKHNAVITDTTSDSLHEDDTDIDEDNDIDQTTRSKGDLVNEILKHNTVITITDPTNDSIHEDDTDIEEADDIEQSTRSKGDLVNDTLKHNTIITITDPTNDSIHGDETDIEEDDDINQSTRKGLLNDILKQNFTDPINNCLHGDDTRIDKANDIDQATSSKNCSELSRNSDVSIQNVIGGGVNSVSLGNIASSVDKKSVSDTVLVGFSVETSNTTIISGTHSNEVTEKSTNCLQQYDKQKTTNGLDKNEKLDEYCDDEMSILDSNNLNYVDIDLSGNNVDDTCSSDTMLSLQVKKSPSNKEEEITNSIESENSFQLHDEYNGENESAILKQIQKESLNIPGNDNNNACPSDILLPIKNKAVPDITVVNEKGFPRNCLDAIKNEYASDSDESSTDNEVDRIKHNYASDSDEVVDIEVNCSSTQVQIMKLNSNKKIEDIVPSESVSDNYTVQNKNTHNATELDNLSHTENKSIPNLTEELNNLSHSGIIKNNESTSFDFDVKSESIIENKETSGKEGNITLSNNLIQDESRKENKDHAHQEKIGNENFPTVIFSTEDISPTHNDDANVVYRLDTQELTVSKTIQIDTLDDGYKYDLNSLNCSLSTSKSNSLKRSFSDSDLSNYIQSEPKTSFSHQSKRKKNYNIDDKPQTVADSFCSSRRNSLSSICNESNVSFCIFIDNAGLLPENCSESEKIQCITEIAEDCLSCVQTDPIVSGIDSAEIVSFVEEINEYSDDFPPEDCTEVEDDRQIEQSWVDDVACVETVVSEDIAEDIIISASTPLSDLSNQECEDDESVILNINDHSDKVKYIYGDKMCSNDAEILETLYRTPQMNVNKKLVNRESQNTVECNKYYDREALEKVLSESTSYSEAIYEPESVAFNTSSLYLPGLEVLENDKENISLDTFSRATSPLDDKEIDFTRNEESISNYCAETQDDTVHSCESSIDNVFSYGQREESSKCIVPSSPEVSSTTTEEKNSNILLKVINPTSKGNPQCSGFVHNRISCKYTETNDYLNTNLRTPARPLITKAAQKYIPPLKDTPKLKVKLHLPQHSLHKLKQLKAAKESSKLSIKVENKPNVVNIENVPNVVNIGNIPNVVNNEYKPNIVNAIRKDIPKKAKPKFEDVLKSIEETQFKMHKDKSKKTKKAVPKVVIKKNENGSHYASTSHDDTTAPDLTGRKWQPWVFLERNLFIDKMALKGNTRAMYNHRKRTYMLAERFKKYKSIASSKFFISKPTFNESSSGRLKYTIMLKHYC